MSRGECESFLAVPAPQLVTVTGVGSRPPSATERPATASASRACPGSAVTSALGAFPANSPTASPVTSALGTGIGSCRCGSDTRLTVDVKR